MKRHKNLEQWRFSGEPEWGPVGAFLIPQNTGTILRVIASDGSEWDKTGMAFPAWEHVSVSLKQRCPTWDEMDFIKRIFWRDDETVMQFHVPRALHINCHPYCLHLWKPIGVQIPLPALETIAPSQFAGK